MTKTTMMATTTMTITDDGDGGLLQSIPACLAVPLSSLSKELGLHPSTCHANRCLANWALVDPKGSVVDQVTYLADCLAAWLLGCLAAWLLGWLGGWVIGWLGGWVGSWVGLGGWLGGWLVGWLGGWLAGWLTGWSAG